MDSFKDVAAVLTAVGAVVAAILGILRYFQYKTKRDKIIQVRTSFDAVVKSLSSDEEVERLAGAILLRRFFDKDTEVGIAGTPYWREAVNVTAAILRGQTSGNFQKLLADGLRLAPSLERADLQRTNLQYAYLGARKKGDPKTNLKDADFYRADLSGASLKDANARGAVFYQARMHNCVLTDANLQDAFFFEADLRGAKFKGAELLGASFEFARNLPPGIAEKLDENGKYTEAKAFTLPSIESGASPIRVFISKPGYLSTLQQAYTATLLTKLESEGMSPLTLEREDYPNFGAFAEVQRLIGDCAGAVILGFKELEIHDGVWRVGSPEEAPMKGGGMPTPWNHIEAGMAAMLGLPILVLCQRGIDKGIFDTAVAQPQVYRAEVEDWGASRFLRSFADWSADVRERSRALTKGAGVKQLNKETGK